MRAYHDRTRLRIVPSTEPLQGTHILIKHHQLTPKYRLYRVLSAYGIGHYGSDCYIVSNTVGQPKPLVVRTLAQWDLR